LENNWRYNFVVFSVTMPLPMSSGYQFSITVSYFAVL
jgi:hypothetical protein